MSERDYLRVLGSADWHQTAFNDHSCYTLNDDILIDACPSVVTQLLEHGVDPVNIPIICFTHMHADHTMGFAPLLLYLRVCCRGDLSGFTIIGPKATLTSKLKQIALSVFDNEAGLRGSIKAFPNIIELEGNTSIDINHYHIDVMDSQHAVPGLCYNITNMMLFLKRIRQLQACVKIVASTVNGLMHLKNSNIAIAGRILLMTNSAAIIRLISLFLICLLLMTNADGYSSKG